jgi:isoleucyl-tRNA synthetase
VLNAGKDDSVFLHSFYTLPSSGGVDQLTARWNKLREIRAVVSKQLEESRTAGSIGSSLQAEVLLHASADDYALLKSLGDDLRFAFITSQAKIAESATAGVEVKVTASANQKCERCWHYRADVGSHSDHATLCNRCVDVVVNHKDEDRQYA